MNINAFNFFITLGAIHGFMMAILLFASRNNRRISNILLALMLCFYTLPVLRVVLLDIGIFDGPGRSFWSVELLYGLGPSLYLYAKTTTDPSYVLRRMDLFHFLPVAAELIYYVSPLYSQNRFFIFTSAIDVKHVIWMTEQIGGIVSIIIYLILTNRLLRSYGKWVKNNYSEIHKKTLMWLQKPVLLYTAFFMLWFSLRAADVAFFSDGLSSNSYYPLLVFLSFSTYWIGTRGYLETHVVSVGFSNEKQSPTLAPADDAQVSQLFSRLEALMKEDKIFLENDLSLSRLADRLQVNQRLLSRSINTKAAKNFYDYVNVFRVREFKRRIAQSSNKQPLLNLAYDCGFGSKATFNHVFKKETGMTPSQYSKENLAGSKKCAPKSE